MVKDKRCEECNKPITDNKFKSGIWEIDDDGKSHQLVFCSESCRNKYNEDCKNDLFTCPNCHRIYWKYQISFGYDRSIWHNNGKKKLIKDPNFEVVSNNDVHDPYHDKKVPKGADRYCKKCAEKLDMEDCDSCGRPIRPDQVIEHSAYGSPFDDR